MKKNLLIALVSFILMSCTSSISEEVDEYSNLAVSGIIVDELSNEPVSFMNVEYSFCIEPDDNGLFRCNSYETGSVESIKEGLFGISLRYKTNKDVLSYFPSISVNNMNYVPIYESKKEAITIEELKKVNRISIKVAKLTRLEVVVKNINPFDDNDKIEIKKFVFEDSEILPRMEYFKVLNRGGNNEKKDLGNNQFLDLLIWNGKVIDSTVDGMIISNRNVYIEYEVTKNSKIYKYKTNPKLISRDSYNYFKIEY